MTLIYRFEVTYETDYMRRANDFMKQLDLGEGRYGFQEVITFRYTAEEKPIQYFKDLITLVFESEKCVVRDIKGGKIE